MVNIQTKEGKRIDSNVYTQVLDSTNYNLIYPNGVGQAVNSVFYETFAIDTKTETYFKETLEINRKEEIKHILVHGETELSKVLKSKFDETTVSKILSFLEQSAKNMFSYSLKDYDNFIMKDILEFDSSFFYKLGYFAPFYYMDENKIRSNVLILVDGVLVHAVRLLKDIYTVEAFTVDYVKRSVVEITDNEYSNRKKLNNLDVYTVRSEKSKYELPKPKKIKDKEVENTKSTKTLKVDKVRRPIKTNKKKEEIA